MQATESSSHSSCSGGDAPIQCEALQSELTEEGRVSLKKQTAWEFHIIGRENVPDALTASLKGDKQVAQIMLAVGKALKNVVNKAKTERSMMCMCLDCETEFSTEDMPVAFGVALPMFPTGDKDVAIASGICFKCYERFDLKEQIIRSLQKLYGPEATLRDASCQ
jgi:hypothetical protein